MTDRSRASVHACKERPLAALRFVPHVRARLCLRGVAGVRERPGLVASDGWEPDEHCDLRPEPAGGGYP